MLENVQQEHEFLIHVKRRISLIFLAISYDMHPYARQNTLLKQ